jgi:hypothetical protein
MTCIPGGTLLQWITWWAKVVSNHRPSACKHSPASLSNPACLRIHDNISELRYFHSRPTLGAFGQFRGLLFTKCLPRRLPGRQMQSTWQTQIAGPAGSSHRVVLPVTYKTISSPAVCPSGQRGTGVTMADQAHSIRRVYVGAPHIPTVAGNRINRWGHGMEFLRTTGGMQLGSELHQRRHIGQRRALDVFGGAHEEVQLLDAFP